MRIEPGQFIPLSELHSYIDTSGVYEIICTENSRAYIGQSTSITQRLFSHVRNLENECHSNALLQLDWRDLGKSAFSFRIVQEIPYTDIAALTKEECREMEIRRRNGIMLYNDHARGYKPALESSRPDRPEQKQGDRSSGPTPRKPQPTRTYNTLVCFDCGSWGDESLTHFKCDDGQFRCQICIERYLGEQVIIIRQTSAPISRASSERFWRWQKGSDDDKTEMTLAISSYIRRFGYKPPKLMMKNPPVDNWHGIEVDTSALANKLYIDMPRLL